MTAPTSEPGSEFSALCAVARDYLDGMIYVDEAKLRRVFHPRCRIVGHFRGRFEFDDLDLFIESVKAEGALPPGTPYYSEIAVVDICGDMAVVKVIDDYLGIRFADYLTMVKHEERWVIVNKAFYVHADH